MSASIGNASLVLTTNSQQMTQGAKKAASEVKGTFGNMSSQLGGMFSKLGGLLKSGIMAGVAAAAAGAAAGAALAFKAATDISDLAGMGRQAEAIGVSSEAYTGLAATFQRVGLDADAVSAVLTDLSDKVQDAAVNGGEAAETFTAMGINARDLMGLPLDQQLMRVADAMQGMPDAGAAAGLAVRLLGGDGEKLLPILRQGSEGIRRYIEEARRMGLAVSEADMAKIKAADEAFKRVGASLQGAWRKVVVAVAPVIEMISNKLSAAMEALEPVFSWVTRALTTHWGIILDILGEVWNAIVEVIQEVGRWVTELFGLQNVSMTIEEVVTGVWRTIGIAGAYAWDTIKAGMGVIAIGVGYLVDGFSRLIGVFGDVVSLAKELPEELRPAGLDRFIAGVEEVRRGVRDTGEGIKNWGRDAVNNFGQSADRVRRWFDNRANRAGPPAAAPGAAPGRRPEEEKPLEYKAVGAVLKGSKEAYSMEAKLRTEGLFKKDKEEKQLKALEQIRDAVRDVVRAVTGIELPALEVR